MKMNAAHKVGKWQLSLLLITVDYEPLLYFCCQAHILTEVDLTAYLTS